MKRFVVPLFLVVFSISAAAGCEPEECKEFKSLICKHCGEGSPACKAIRKRRGRDEKKCKAGVRHIKARVKTEAGKKTLCTLLNDERPKK